MGSDTVLARPETAVYHKEWKATHLIFPDKAADLNGRYYLNGGICWPMPTADGIRGYALLLGMNVKTKQCYVFEEREFVSVDHIIAPDQTIKQEGVSTFFSECRQKYFVRRWFYNQHEYTHEKHQTEIYRSDMIDTKPHFLRAQWEDIQQPYVAMMELRAQGRLAVATTGKVFKETNGYEIMEKKPPPPALYALLCVLAGLQEYPWREPKRKPRLDEW